MFWILHHILPKCTNFHGSTRTQKAVYIRYTKITFLSSLTEILFFNLRKNFKGIFVTREISKAVKNIKTHTEEFDFGAFDVQLGSYFSPKFHFCLQYKYDTLALLKLAFLKCNFFAHVIGNFWVVWFRTCEMFGLRKESQVLCVYYNSNCEVFLWQCCTNFVTHTPHTHHSQHTQHAAYSHIHKTHRQTPTHNMSIPSTHPPPYTHIHHTHTTPHAQQTHNTFTTQHARTTHNNILYIQHTTHTTPHHAYNTTHTTHTHTQPTQHTIHTTHHPTHPDKHTHRYSYIIIR